MVRLKVRPAFTIRQNLDCFNTFMVRLKDSTGLKASLPEVRFNTFMVRLKGERGEPLAGGGMCFNTFMVRLKGECFLFFYKVNEFQYLYGSIKSVKVVLNQVDYSICFNTFMVRLKEGRLSNG